VVASNRLNGGCNWVRSNFGLLAQRRSQTEHVDRNSKKFNKSRFNKFRRNSIKHFLPEKNPKKFPFFCAKHRTVKTEMSSTFFTYKNCKFLYLCLLCFCKYFFSLPEGSEYDQLLPSARPVHRPVTKHLFNEKRH